jgi:hypothetical protein
MQKKCAENVEASACAWGSPEQGCQGQPVGARHKGLSRRERSSRHFTPGRSGLQLSQVAAEVR